jgi:hypothetical protein
LETSVFRRCLDILPAIRTGKLEFTHIRIMA